VPRQQPMKCATRPQQFQVQYMTVLHWLGQEEIPVQVQGTVKYSIKILFLETWWGIQCTLSPLIMDSHQEFYTTTILVGIMGYRLMWLNWLQLSGLYIYVILFHILLCWYFIEFLASSQPQLARYPYVSCLQLLSTFTITLLIWRPCHLPATWGAMTWSQTTYLTCAFVNTAMNLHVT